MAAAKNPPRGEDHYCAKLTEDDVRLIRQCVAERERLLKEARKLTNAAIAEKFNVKKRTVEAISSRRSWIHVLT